MCQSKLNSISYQAHNSPLIHLPGMVSTPAREREERRRRKKEEKATLAELKRSDKTKQCPGCKIWIERIDGCDHMTCQKCNVSLPRD